MKTITKRCIVNELLRVRALNNKKSTGIALAEEIIHKYFQIIEDAILTGKYVYFRNHGVIKATFKPGGRPVRAVKSNVSFPMPDTVGIKFTLGATKPGRVGKAANSKIDKLLDNDIGIIDIGSEVSRIIRRYLDEVKQGKARIEIRKFGVFKPFEYERGFKRNPKTGEEIWQKNKIDIRFKPSPFMIKKAMAIVEGDDENRRFDQDEVRK